MIDSSSRYLRGVCVHVVWVCVDDDCACACFVGAVAVHCFLKGTGISVLVLLAFDLIIAPFWTTSMRYAVTQEHARLEADESAKVWVALNSSSFTSIITVLGSRPRGWYSKY